MTGNPQPTAPVNPTGSEDGITLDGGSYNGVGGPGIGPAQCKATCDADNRCVGWTFVKPGYPNGPGCFLKSTITRKVANPCCTSGIKPTSPTPTTISTPPSAPAPTVSNSGLVGTWDGDGDNYHLGFRILDQNGALYLLINGDPKSAALTIAGRQISWVRPDWGQRWTGTISSDPAGNPRIDGRIVATDGGKDIGGYFAIRNR
jgi:hypothetical protein